MRLIFSEEGSLWRTENERVSTVDIGSDLTIPTVLQARHNFRPFDADRRPESILSVYSLLRP